MPSTSTKPKRRYKNCSCCDNSLDEEESLSPRRDGRFVICDECYHEKFEFTCCRCENYEHVDHQHNIVVVFRAEDAFSSQAREAGFTAGIYRIKRCPYYGSDYFSAWLNEDCLERIADLWCSPEDAEDEYCPCGHLCLECQQKLTATR